jgi:hypothetical protein
VEKNLKILGLKDKSNDFLYRTAKAEIERLQAVEIVRQQYLNYRKDVQPRLQRVYKIINQKRS